MLDKHPQSASHPLPPDPVPPPVAVSELVVWKAVGSFPNGSAPGPSGLQPSHLCEAGKCPSPDQSNQVLDSLTSFVNSLASGQAPSFVTSHLCGATPLASKKPKGGNRPIAVGEVLC